MKTFPQFLSLFALAALPLAAQDATSKPFAAWVADAGQLLVKPDHDATGFAIALVSLDETVRMLAPLLPVLADAEVYAAKYWPAADAAREAIVLPRLPGLTYFVQVVLLDPVEPKARATRPMPVAEEEGDEPADRAGLPMAKPMPLASALDPTDGGAAGEPGEQPPTLDELAAQMKFWFDEPKGAAYGKLRAEFRTSRAGYAWGEGHVRQGADGYDVYFVLEVPSGAAGHLLVEARHETSVALPIGARGVRIHLGLVGDDGTATEFAPIREL